MDKNNLNIPDTLPMLPVRDIVVYPYMIIPLFVGRDSSIQAVEESLSKNRLIFLSSQKQFDQENPTPEDIYKTGTVAMIMRMRKLADGRVKILIQGVAKAEIKNFDQSAPFFKVAVDRLDDVTSTASDYATKSAELISSAKVTLEKIIALGKVLSPDILLVLDDINDPGRVSDLIASNLGLKVGDAQRVLETTDVNERLELVIELLNTEFEAIQLQSKAGSSSKDDMSKSQREYFLREQMKAIKNELGDGGDSKSDDMEETRKKIIDANMPEEVLKEALKQLGRLERMHPDASEASMLRNYLDWMSDLPWTVGSEDKIDLEMAKVILEEDHFGLEKAKDRILEFLAVKKLKNDLKGPILCFAGPPGVGKTSLGRSIAKAMGREYHRIALGGVKDEAEIRGHRRTYVGAMPGKVIQALKQCGTNNPVFVLDEIDKLGSDFRGDPSAAMLEVLDPEQNSAFKDNYLNVDFDLSNVLFIATANVIENIPSALKDRMELIHISGYTRKDKLEITKRHIVRKQLDNNGVTTEQCSFTDDSLEYLISHYTREAGLRNLEREVGSVCRKVAKKIVLGEVEKFDVDKDSVTDLLGAPKFLKEERLDADTIGVCTGLAWTMAGGEVLYVEALSMKGKGGFTLTGQMGDVMKESATAALSYSRAHAKELGIEASWFDDNHLHIHLPAGAVPKDGPSAGITMATAIISRIKGVSVKKDVAMTGEVTLTGRVLPIGGLKEKALAAYSHGVKTVIAPIANKMDIEDIPEEIRNSLKFIFVEHLDEVLQIALTSSKASGKSKKNHEAAA